MDKNFQSKLWLVAFGPNLAMTAVVDKIVLHSEIPLKEFSEHVVACCFWPQFS